MDTIENKLKACFSLIYGLRALRLIIKRVDDTLFVTYSTDKSADEKCTKCLILAYFSLQDLYMSPSAVKALKIADMGLVAGPCWLDTRERTSKSTDEIIPGFAEVSTSWLSTDERVRYLVD